MSRTSDCSCWIAISNVLGRRIWLSNTSIEDVLALVLNTSVRCMDCIRYVWGLPDRRVPTGAGPSKSPPASNSSRGGDSLPHMRLGYQP